MRPLLASLALLLLALSRPTNADSSSSSAAALPGGMTEEKAQEMIMDVGASFGAFISYVPPGVMPKFLTGLKTQLDHTVLCKLADTTSADSIKKAIYGDGPRPVEEEKSAKELGINCATTVDAEKQLDEWKCFCTQQRVIFYCILHKYKREKIPATLTAPGACMKTAYEALKNAGTKELGKSYNYANKEAFTKLYVERYQKLYSDDESISSSQEMVNLLCDAIDPQVKTAVEALFKHDYSYSFVERVFMVGMIIGASGSTDIEAIVTNLETSCADANFKAEEAFNKCICEEDKGFTFCLFNNAALAYKEKGYLKCESPTKTVDAAKKPAVKPKPALLKQKEPAPGPVLPTTPKGGDSNKDATTGAASTSSLLVPLAAAAAMLLRH